jgi:hypothetical protein
MRACYPDFLTVLIGATVSQVTPGTAGNQAKPTALSDNRQQFCQGFPRHPAPLRKHMPQLVGVRPAC